MRKIIDFPLDILLHIGEFLNEYAFSDGYGYGGIDYDERSYFAAVINEFEMLQHYLKRCSGSTQRRKMLCAVVKAGNINAVKYLHESGCPWNARACAGAAERGHMEILKYLHESGCPWDEYACSIAAEGGHMEILKYLHSNNCTWNERECLLRATEGGHVEIVQYLVSNGCPIDHDDEELSNALYNLNLDL